MGIVTALAVVGVGVVTWANFRHQPASAATPTKSVASTSTRSSAATAAAARKASRMAALHRAANERWHRGFQPWGHPTGSRLPVIYYEQIHSHFSCAGYASFGCWKARVIARSRCPHGVTILVDEMRDGAEVATITGSSRPLGPRTPAVVEIDASRRQISGQIGSMICS